jgi:hypothetical protein
MHGRKRDGGVCAMRKRGNQAAYLADRLLRLKAALLQTCEPVRNS